jgi:hypothetical protein
VYLSQNLQTRPGRRLESAAGDPSLDFFQLG